MPFRYTANAEFSFHAAIPNILLERVRFSDYVLVGTEGSKQVYKRGSFGSMLAFWVGGGDWEKSPTKLTIKYLPLPGKMRVEFVWELNYPIELTEEEQRGYQA
jgi:hypothetical protein